MQEVVRCGESEGLPVAVPHEVIAARDADPVGATKPYPQPSHQHRRDERGGEARHHHHGLTGKGNPRRHQHDRIDCRRRQQEGKGRRRRHAACHQRACHGHRRALAARQHHACEARHRHRERVVLRQHPLPESHGNECRDRRREQHTQHEEGRGLHHDGHENCGPGLQCRAVEEPRDPALAHEQHHQPNSEPLEGAEPPATSLLRRLSLRSAHASPSEGNSWGTAPP
ncbi:unannotated protein [freshwater metagenome]|uniref:Unannotated protein n=1 Tax=freshwater metagenome TaxID=449393 RepID=A0A6J7QFE0_9ZZZZ